MDYNKYLTKIEKPERLIPILSAIVATGVAGYIVKSAISSSNNLKSVKGTEEIPVPEGAAFYLGTTDYYCIKFWSLYK
jgi:hypothetical protein